MPRKALAYVRGQATEIDLFPIGNGHYLEEDAALNFNRMREAAAREGINLVVNSSFRTMEAQSSLWERFTAGTFTDLVAKPGYSNHQSGIAVDIEVGRVNTSRTYLWLRMNGPTYGYVNTGATFSSPEYWHWEYKPHA